MANDTIRKCSFCGKPEDKVRTLFSAGTSHICDECVLYCYNVLAEQEGLPATKQRGKGKNSADSGITLKKPAEIKAVLDEYVIGQEEAKIALSVAVIRNSYRKMLTGRTAITPMLSGRFPWYSSFQWKRKSMKER